MARYKKTGGQDFKKGEGGRKKGSKDKYSRIVTKTFKAIAEAVLESKTAEVAQALEKRLLQGSHHHLRLVADYVDGKPVQKAQVNTPDPLHIILQTDGETGHAPGGAPDAGRGRPAAARAGSARGQARTRRAFILPMVQPYYRGKTHRTEF